MLKKVNSEKVATSPGTEGIIHSSKTLNATQDGQITELYSISAGLDYPGIGLMHANLLNQKRKFISVDDDDAKKWGLCFHN